MAIFLVSKYVSPGQAFTVSYTTAAPASGDTIVINGVRQTLAEWKRNGVVTQTADDTVGKVATYYAYANSEIVGSAPNGSSVSSNV
jgi:hypothetical protein